MTNTENNKQTNFKNGCAGCLSLIVLIFIAFAGCSVMFPQKEKTAEEKVNEWYDETSHFSCQRVLKERLRDPDSYKKDGDFNIVSDNGSEKVITWRFRAKNGFGGYNSSAGICNISKENGGTVNPSIVNE